MPLSDDVQAFFEREVKPHVPDAWINTAVRDHKDGEVGKVGYEINFNRYFYNTSRPGPWRRSRPTSRCWRRISSPCCGRWRDDANKTKGSHIVHEQMENISCLQRFGRGMVRGDTRTLEG